MSESYEKFEVFNQQQEPTGCLPDDPTGPIIDQIKIGEHLPHDPSRLANENAVKFYKLSYKGGHFYKFGRDADGQPVFVEHEQESPQGIKRRKRLSTYYNYCGPVVDWYVGTVFTRPVQRDFSDQNYGQFMLNCDQMETPLAEQLQHSMTQAMISGEHYLVMDSTLDSSVETQAQAEASGAQMFLASFDYTNVYCVRYQNQKLTECLIRISSDEARIYDYDYIYIIQIKDGKVMSISSPIPHEYGTIPVVQVQCNPQRESFISDIAEGNKSHFNLNSILMEELCRQTWTQWIGLGLAPEELKALTAGGRKIYCVDKDKNGVAFEQLTADISQADSLRKSIDESVNEIYRAAGVSRPDVQNKGPESGRALIVRASEVARKARMIADYAEKAERQIANLWAGGMDTEIPVEVNYPEEFHLEAMDEELGRTLQLVGANVPNVLKREQIRTLGKHILQDSVEDYKVLEDDLETIFPDGKELDDESGRTEDGKSRPKQEDGDGE